MPKKCRRCNLKQIEYPIWEGQEEGEKFSFGKIKWMNMIIGDWTKTLLMLMLLLALFAYVADNKAITELYENPCEFVNKNYQACNSIDEQNTPSFIIGDGLNIEPKLDVGSLG